MKENYEVFYYKKQVEIDFVLFSNGKVTELIQVVESLEDRKTYNREVRAFRSAFTELKPKTLKLITLHEESKIKFDDQHIEVIPVIKWLLKS